MASTIYTEKSDFSLVDLMQVLNRRYKLLILVSAIVFSIAVLAALFLPAIYRSSAIILIEQQEIPTDFVRSTVTSFADQRIQVISQRVMTSSNLIEIMDKYDLYPKLRERETREKVLDEMRDNISRKMISADVVDPRSGRPVEATIAFQLAFEHRSPGTAQKVANELVSLYLNENLKTRTEAAQETSAFLTAEAARLRETVSGLRGKVSGF